MDTLVPYQHYNGTDAQLFQIEQIRDVYTYHVREFVKWVRDNLRSITEDTIRDYFIHLNKSDYAAGTKRIKRQSVKKRVRQLMKDAPLDKQIRLDKVLNELDNYGETKAPKVNTSSVGKDKVLTTGEVERLLLSTHSEKQYLFIKFLYVTGCRVSEMIGIKIKHAEIVKNMAVLRVIGKGNKERYVKVPVALYERIRREFQGNTFLFETSHGNAYNRCYISTQIAKLGKKNLNKRISAHTMRHSFATHMIAQGINVSAVSKYLGHSSVAITLNLYVHLELSDEELDRFIENIAA